MARGGRACLEDVEVAARQQQDFFLCKHHAREEQAAAVEGGGGTSGDAAEGADVDAAGDADAKDGALALRQRESVGRERRAGGAKACAGTTVVPQNMSLLSTSMEEVVELKAHLRTPHTS